MKTKEVNLMNIQAVDNKVICVLMQKSNVTENGIVMPDEVSTEPQKYGEVLSVGEEVSTIKKGDIVIFHMNAGQCIVLQGVVCQVLMYGEVYGVVGHKEEEKIIS